MTHEWAFCAQVLVLREARTTSLPPGRLGRRASTPAPACVPCPLRCGFCLNMYLALEVVARSNLLLTIALSFTAYCDSSAEVTPAPSLL